MKKTKYVILGLLTIEPLSGYDIKKMIDESISHFWSESNGQLYPTLGQLVKENFIVHEEKEQNGKRASNIYSITEKGRKELEKWLEETTETKSTHRDEELLKLFFGTNVSQEKCIELLKRREKRVGEKLDQYTLIQKRLEKHKSSPHFLYWSLDLNNGICQAEAELKWCRASIKTLQQGG